jgi:PST family polysaccharide transporter
MRKYLDNNRKSILTNALWLFADKFLRMGVGFFVSVWVARYLGPEQYGVFNYTLSFVAMFSCLCTLGLDGIVVRDIVGAPEKTNEIMGSAFVLKLCGSLLATVLSLCAITVVKKGDASLFLYVAIICSGQIFLSANIIDLYFQSQVKSKYSVYAQNCAFLLLSAFKVVMILNKASLTAFVWANLAESLLSMSLMVVLYRKNHHNIKDWHSNTHTMAMLLKQSWPFIISGFAVMVYLRLDQVILGSLKDSRQVGLYSVAVRMIELWYVVPGIISSSVFPALVAIGKESREKLYEQVQKLYTFMLWVAIFAACMISLAAAPLIAVVFGAKYAESAPILSLLAWIAVPMFASFPRQRLFYVENKLTHGLHLELWIASLSLLSNLYFIPRLGAKGAALSALIANIVSEFIVAIYLQPFRDSLLMYGKSLIAPFTWLRNNLFPAGVDTR